MTAGGGLDFKLMDHISMRSIQAECFTTTFSDLNNNRQNNFRFTAAVVVKF